jgi:hypothetical protein
MSHLGCRLKLSNSESGCKVAALHLLLYQGPPIAFCRSADENSCAFQLFIQFQISVSLLETEGLL